MAFPLVAIGVQLGIAIVAGVVTKVATRDDTPNEAGFSLTDGISMKEAAIVAGGAALAVGAILAVNRAGK